MIIDNNTIIGINSSGIMNASNVGFAVPISYFNTVYHKNLLNKKKQLIKLPKLGIEKTNLTEEFCKFYNMFVANKLHCGKFNYKFEFNIYNYFLVYILR